MSKFFNPDTPLMQFLTRLADLIILNLLFLLTSLPVITIGASWTALYCMTLKMVQDEEEAIAKSYFYAFRHHFRRATLLWMEIMALAVLILLDMLILARTPGYAAVIVRTVIEVLAFLLLMILQYLFPYLAQFDASIRETIRNACLLAFAYLPKTAMMAIAVIGAIYISGFNNLTISIGIALWLLLGFAVIALGYSAILEKIFSAILQKNCHRKG